METYRVKGRSIGGQRGQRGVVLLIALIMLVAMTLAGIGMMRSVDTGNVIAGNLAFQQATVQASDAGTSAGFNALAGVGNSGNEVLDRPILNWTSDGVNTCPAGATAAAANCQAANVTRIINFPGYFSTPILACEVDRTCALASNYLWYRTTANWAGAPTITMADANGVTIATVNYLTHRMCTLPGVAPNLPGAGPNVCQTYSEIVPGSCSKGGLVFPCQNDYVFYRITARSVGVRNTVTYTQTLALIQFP